jgi:hypothetical protein
MNLLPEQQRAVREQLERSPLISAVEVHSNGIVVTGKRRVGSQRLFRAVAAATSAQRLTIREGWSGKNLSGDTRLGVYVTDETVADND